MYLSFLPYITYGEGRIQINPHSQHAIEKDIDEMKDWMIDHGHEFSDEYNVFEFLIVTGLSEELMLEFKLTFPYSEEMDPPTITKP